MSGQGLRRSGWLAVGVAALGAAPVAAQVTAEEVWTSNEAYWEALGFDLEGSLRREGPVVTASGITATMAFPLGSGTAALLLPDLVLTEQGDGTVRLDLAPETMAEVDVRLASGGGLAFPLTLAWVDRDAVASGTPGDVTFRLRSGRFDLELGEVAVWGESVAPDLEIDLSLSIASVDITTRVTEGALVGIVTESSYGPTLYDYSFGFGAGSEQRTAGRMENSSATTALTLPAGGPDLLRLGDELRAGLAIDMQGRNGVNLEQSVSTLPGQPRSEETFNSGPVRQQLRLDAEGLAIAGEIDGFGYAGTSELVPAGIEGDVEVLAWDWALPLLASEERQPVRFGLTFKNLTATPGTWAAVDPGAALPREPVTLDLLAGGEVTLPFDLFDPQGWARVASTPGLPFELNSAALERLEVKGLGLSGLATGAFTFDNGDLLTFDGLPRPEGMASGTVEGAQGLLDRLVAVGFLSPEDAFAARMALASAFKAEGPDRAGSVLEVTPDGSVLLNGQKVR